MVNLAFGHSPAGHDDHGLLPYGLACTLSRKYEKAPGGSGSLRDGRSVFRKIRLSDAAMPPGSGPGIIDVEAAQRLQNLRVLYHSERKVSGNRPPVKGRPGKPVGGTIHSEGK
jgi:hypothetical protein